MKPKLITSLIIGLFLCSFLNAQESVNTASGNASGSGGSVSYSVGEIVYTTNAGDNGAVAQGVQQAYEISAVTGIEEAKDISPFRFSLSKPNYRLPDTRHRRRRKDTISYVSLRHAREDF
jgi:hypothetical protein